MKFEDIHKEAQDLSSLITVRAGRSLIVAVTVPEPNEPLDELYFVRVIHWAYVLFNEAGNIVFKELNRFLKSNDPPLAHTYQEGKRNIEALRTLIAHNLPDDSKENARTKRIAEAWLLQHGAPDDWAVRCFALLQVLRDMLAALRQSFLRLADLDNNSTSGLDQLIVAVDKAWPPHLFDTLIKQNAERITLPPFDVVKFRKPRQQEWAEIAALFSTRDEAEYVLNRVILNELKNIFGSEYVN